MTCPQSDKQDVKEAADIKQDNKPHSPEYESAAAASKATASAPVVPAAVTPSSTKEAQKDVPLAETTQARTKPTDDKKSEQDSSKENVPVARAQSSAVSVDTSEKEDAASQHTNKDKDGSDGASAKQEDTPKSHGTSVSVEQNIKAKRNEGMAPATATPVEENTEHPETAAVAAAVTKDSDSDKEAPAILVSADKLHVDHEAKGKDGGDAAEGGNAGKDSSSRQQVCVCVECLCFYR
jgi:hypothetical protein